MPELRLITSRTGTVDVREVHGNLTAYTATILHSQLELLLQRRPRRLMQLAGWTALAATAPS